MQATDDGRAYRAGIGRALEALEDANAGVQHAKATPSGHLRVTAPTDLGLFVVAPLVARFAERFPDVTVEMILTEALLDFDAHQIDIALRVRVAISASDYSFSRQVALADGGIALLPWLIAEGDVRNKSLVPVLEKYVALCGALYLVHQGGRVVPPKVRVFKDELVAAFRARTTRQPPMKAV